MSGLRPQHAGKRSRKVVAMARIFVFHLKDNDVFAWNIDASVGINSPNRRADVELVQFGYFALSRGPKANPTVKAFAKDVIPGAPYSGAENDPLTLAILEHQIQRGGTKDGHVSPVTGTTGQYSTFDGPHTFQLMVLVNNMRDLLGRDFPRIDKHERCPQVLREAVRACFDT